MSSIMKSELERLADVALSHGRDDPAIDLFLVFVGALDPLPGVATLQPAAKRIGKLRLAEALDRPGEGRLGACRLLAALVRGDRPARPRNAVAARVDRVTNGGRREPLRTVGGAGRSGDRTLGTVTVERPVATAHRLPELFEALVHAIRGALSLLA